VTKPKRSLFEVQSGIGEIARHFVEATAAGEKPKQSLNFARKGLQHSQDEQDATNLAWHIDLACGRVANQLGQHFHIWPDDEQTRKMVYLLNTFVAGLEKARTIPKGKPKHRQELRNLCYEPAKALINQRLNESGIDYWNDGTWEPCSKNFESCNGPL
jgi:hypothetical protein